MKVAVIGASGRTGRLVVNELLANGYEVRAMVHSKNCFIEPKNKLEVVICDVTDYLEVRKSLANVGLIVSCIGHTRLMQADIQTQAMINISRALKELRQNDARVISLSGSGIRVSNDKPSMIDRVMNFVISKVDKSRIGDGIKHYQYLLNSDLNWTIVRVLKLTNGELQPYKLTSHGPAMTFVSRRTVASAICKMLETDAYDKQLPVVSSY